METALKAAQNGIMSFANTAGRAVLGTMTWRCCRPRLSLLPPARSRR
jgi:hypothetical protein